jgi:transcriptional regulator with XRE-family HTH domain
MSAEALRNLGRAIRLTREEHGVGIPEMAAESGLAAAYLEGLEAGQIDPDLDSFMLVADALARAAGVPGIRPSTFVIRTEELERG